MVPPPLKLHSGKMPGTKTFFAIANGRLSGKGVGLCKGVISLIVSLNILRPLRHGDTQSGLGVVGYYTGGFTPGYYISLLAPRRHAV